MVNLPLYLWPQSVLEARRGRKGAKQYLKQLETGPAESGLVRPLIDTGELRKSVTYVIMKKEKEVKRGST